MKTCNRCLQLLPADCFYNRPRKEIKYKTYRTKESSNLTSYCKPCSTILRRELNHRNGTRVDYTKNKSCAVYLEVHIAERLLSNVFVNTQRMPFNNIGYDFICGKGFKVDVKSSCFHSHKDFKKHPPFWEFGINRNKIADYFACIALDNRLSLTPVHLWIIPGYIVNTKSMITISLGSLSKWLQYEQPLDKIFSACDVLRVATLGELDDGSS